MFYYKTSFSKKAVFLEKTGKNPFAKGQDHFEGRGRLTTEINVTFFVGIDVLNIFYWTILLKKNNISQNNSKKSFFLGGGRQDHFWGNGALDDKMNVTFLGGNGVPNTIFKFFSQKTPIPSDLNSKSWFWGHISPYLSVVLLRQLFPKTIGFTHEWMRTNHVNFMKIGS